MLKLAAVKRSTIKIVKLTVYCYTVCLTRYYICIKYTLQVNSTCIVLYSKIDYSSVVKALWNALRGRHKYGATSGNQYAARRCSMITRLTRNSLTRIRVYSGAAIFARYSSNNLLVHYKHARIFLYINFISMSSQIVIFARGSLILV